MNERHAISRRSFLIGMAAATSSLAAGSFLAACTPPAPGATPAGDSPAGEPAELTFMTWWMPPLVLVPAVEHAVEEFNENHPDILATLDPNPGGTDAQLQKWQTALATDTPPDVTQMRPHFHTAFAYRDAFVRSMIISTQTRLSREDFWPQTIERLSWDGKFWGLAAEIWFSFTFLNWICLRPPVSSFPTMIGLGTTSCASPLA